MPVACNVLGGADAAENEMWQAMHLADQFEAFKALIDAGQGPEEVAARFGVTPTVVRQRMKLATVSPKLMALYRKAERSLDQLLGFTVSDDFAEQEAAWFEAPEWQRRANAIRQTLTAAHVKADDRRARFVTVEAYVGAGGGIIADLFQTGSEGYLTDPALLDRLMREKLEREAEAVRQEGWKRPVAMTDRGPNRLAARGRNPRYSRQRSALLRAVGSDRNGGIDIGLDGQTLGQVS